ncbi:hypothetical protein M422DRAFT_258258 [Sphaerobolus stellatus SS14]|uniref:Uncharacterized protein n=1 Tax=Sphaerobolus stellatus (strain SS14) TaxID=990650 RepID=A0A0C9VN08_SPHS4|nr:hypothetical protein M422DRAFT_258258 [Sphaerobolus stellatus SS14]
MPFFLLHLPPETQEEVDEADPETEEHDGFMSHIGAAIWNPALGASNGLLQGRIEGFLPPRLE